MPERAPRLRGRLLLTVLALAAMVTACADAPGGGDAAADPGAGGPSRAENDLVVELDHGDGSPVESWSLTCAGTAEGTHPEPEAACEHLAAVDDPFAPLPADVVCTEQYGGPQTAHVTGRWDGQPVDLELSRVDGCRIAQWDGLGPLLPGPVG